MKKFIPIFSLFIVFLFPIRGKCADFALTTESLDLISNGFQAMETSSYAQFGFMTLSGEAKQSPYSTFANTNINNLLTNNDITNVYTFDSMDFDTYESTESWEDFITLDGKSVSRDDVRLIEFDNGYYSGRAFVSSDGYLLKRGDIADSSTLVNLRFGGGAISASDWGLLGVDVSQAIQDVNYSYNYQTHSSAGNMSYYVVVARPNPNNGLPGACYSVFVANQYIPGLIVPTISDEGSWILSWYTNDPSLVEYKSITNVETSERLSVTPGNYSKNGYNYDYLVTFNNGSLPTYAPSNMTLLDWLERTNSNFFNYNFGIPDSWNYHGALEDDLVDVFVPTSDIGALDMSTIYGLDDVIGYVDNNVAEGVIPNYNYDTSSAIGVGNLPFILDWDFDLPVNPPIPLTNEIAVPGDVAIDEPIPIIIPSEIPDLPIVSGLASRFPFSIPWDIKNMLYGLRGRQVAPCFHISWYIQPLNYTWEFDLDLSSFNAQAEIFRTLILISFIIGLALFSYRHFFGM